ncbi:hypothetical protein FGU65_06060 [Methanoculleus sp. FWC-SCC1]|uniref:PIN domain-containing protein n=1 Tax=Methanoculleus frigidifontis TaxID=2584085 RepID=A0ABT8M950_9EURY|nr:hypothetical protein [Methanoculleus sp. FWC-SCC1]MDN7024456.1 hypothetical protein [Methanoculleus sp. FWC-SCC1]
MIDAIVRADEVQVLLNTLGEVRISYPLYEGDLLVARPHDAGYALEISADRETLSARQESFGSVAGELPSFSDLLECLLASGILRYDNQDAFEEMVPAYRRLKKDVFFGLDTNLFYHRFASRCPAIDPAQYLIVDTVRDEITFAINHKYSAERIAEIAGHAPAYAPLIGELENKRTRKSRKAAYLALREYRSIRDRATEIASPGQHSHRNAENDLNIARALRRFEEERYALPVLLTADIYMADLCDAEGIEYFFFERPYTAETAYCSAGAFREFLFTLAAAFGFIRCNGVDILGEYGGKGNALDDLKLRFGDDAAGDEFMREVTVCRRLIDLGIER